ncbi:MAG: AMP-dependent synthetase/ligase [Mycobacteriales bacterium]
MQELSRLDEEVPVAEDATLSDPVFDRAADEPDRVVFSRKEGDEWQPVTAKEFAEQVERLAAGLIASGVEPGDRIGLMSHTRYEWTLCDYAIWTAGAVTVPVYETSSAEQLAWYLGDSGAVAAFVENEGYEKTLKEACSELPDIANVWQLEGDGLDTLRDAGKDVPAEQVQERRKTATPSSTATVIYTSGTTGKPKGCELTHGNFIYAAASTADDLEELFAQTGSTLLFLPLAHVFARIIQVGCVANGVRMGHTADIKNLMSDFQAFKPTFILSVPRIFEKVYTSAQHKAHADGKGMIFDRAEKAAIAYSRSLDATLPRPLTKLQHALFDRLVFSKLRAVLGGEVSYAVSGGAPLGERLGHFFRGIGVTVLEGYGLTETTATATVNLPTQMKIGTVGRPVRGSAVKIDKDGEVLLKGGNIFTGYWHNEDATKETMADEWFRTGDLGELDKDGYLKITGRQKELIVTAGGKNVSPAVLEDGLRRNKLVSQCIIVGDQKPFIGALVTIDEEAFGSWKKEHGKDSDATVEDLREDDDLRGDIEAAVADANKAVSKAESIRKFRILPVDFTEEGGQLTPSMKLKRSVVLKEFEDEVSALYDE